MQATSEPVWWPLLDDKGCHDHEYSSSGHVDAQFILLVCCCSDVHCCSTSDLLLPKGTLTRWQWWQLDVQLFGMLPD